MTKMSDLPRELVEKILFKIPVACMREVRSTCKEWNILSKHLGKAAAAKEGEILAIVLKNYSVYLMSINLHGIHNKSDQSIKTLGKLISLNNDSDNVDIFRVCHCEGLLLCTTRDQTRLVVLNPYTGQNRCICVGPIYVVRENHWYDPYCLALGYEENKSCRAYKILRFAYLLNGKCVHDIYEFNSNSWRRLDVTHDGYTYEDLCGVSLKGNTYWYAINRQPREDVPDFLLCFDFTNERFGPHLPLPFESFQDVATLSEFGEEQLALLVQHYGNFGMDVWVTTMIEPSAVSWSKFIVVDDMITPYYESFLIDKDKKAIVVFAEDVTKPAQGGKASIIGENGYLRKVDLGEITTRMSLSLECSYVPSSVFF